MKIFTHEESEPSQSTINFIREFAYTYRALEFNGKTHAYCLN